LPITAERVDDPAAGLLSGSNPRRRSVSACHGVGAAPDS